MSGQALVDPVTTLRANLDALPLVTRQAVELSRAEGVIQRHSTASLTSASVWTPDGRSVRLHSGRDPVTEADRFLDAALPEALPPAVFVIGSGLGYVLEAIERRSAGTKVIAIEPFPAITRAMLERRDWREWTRSGRLTILLGPEYLGASEAWKALDVRAASPSILEHLVLAREFPVEVARAHRLADAIVRGAQANDEARRKFAGLYLLNTLANLPVICSEGDVSTLFGAFSGTPGIVVAAGPSLDHNIEAIRAVMGRALIIAVDTALRPLLAAGIRPHLVVAVDPQSANAQHLNELPDTHGIWFVAEGSIDPGVFPQFAGHAFNFKVSDHHPWPWLRAHGADRGTLRAWGSVLTTAFDLACQLGCDPIVFAGADLSYTNGLLYCRNTSNERYWSHLTTVADRAEAVRECLGHRTTSTASDIRGASVVSTPDFLQFRDWLVTRSVAVQPRRVLNATGAGILHGGAITQIDLTTLSIPLPAGGAEGIQARLGAAWHRSVEHRDCVVERLDGPMSRQDGDGIPLGPWLEFAGDTATSEQIVSGLETARRSIVLAWRSAPQVTAHPASLCWIPTSTASFTAAATGGPAPTVQWQVSADGGASWSDIVGATATACDVAMTTADIGKRYRATFANPSGFAATTGATITIAASGLIHDFNGDGKPDILWRSSLTGANVIWYMDGVMRTGLGELMTVPGPEWMLVGVGDFNGDGKPGILWHHAVTGDHVIWLMDGVTRTRCGLLESEPDRAWRIVATGDFNGDGRAEILWRHAVTGANRVWYMEGMAHTGSGALAGESELAWTVVGTADFSGSGQSDILWRHAVTGVNRVWYMEGTTRTGSRTLEAEPDPAWTVVGTGDFNGDGKPDILWRHAVTGADRIWYLDGVTRMGLGCLSAAAESTCVGSPEALPPELLPFNPPFGPAMMTAPRDVGAACFLITSWGHSGSVWLAGSLNLHEAVRATAGVLNPIECFALYPLNQDAAALMERAGPELSKYGFGSPDRPGFSHFRSAARLRGIDITARDVVGLPGYVFDELALIATAAPVKAIGNVHGITLSQMQEAYRAEPDIFKGRRVVIVDSIRHPVGRTESAIDGTVKYHLTALELHISAFIHAHADECLELERRYKIDFSEPRPRAALHVYRQGLHNDVWANELRLFPSVHRLVIERLQAEPEYFAHMFRTVTQGRLVAEKAYLDRVFAPENLGDDRRHPTEQALLPDPRKQYERWSPFERAEFDRVVHRLGASALYLPVGYDLSFVERGMATTVRGTGASAVDR